MLTNRLKKILPKYHTYYDFWRLLNIIVAGALLVGATLTVFFIYQNINTALVNTALITDVKTRLTFDTLDIESYEKIKNIIATKQAVKPISNNLRNIFVYGQTGTDKK